MITNYHRPQNLEEAITLIGRNNPKTLPLGGGTHLSHPQPDEFEIVDLQALGLDRIHKTGNHLHIGATTTLQQLLESRDFPDSLKPALKLEAPLNLRNTATAAGTLVVSDGRSTFASIMLGLDAKLVLQPNRQEIQIGNMLPLRVTVLKGKLITEIIVPLDIKVAVENISRTPSDKPIISVTLARWPSGRTRLVLGGFGKTPILAMDGNDSDDLETSARIAFDLAEDDWASAEYRRNVVTTLVKRCLIQINQPAA